jgi:hypothetical protein
MNITIIKEDRLVSVDGDALNFDYNLDDNIWAIQWNGVNGEVEHNDGSPNESINSFSDYQYLVDAFNVEKQRLADEATQAQADTEAARTYVEKREEAYPPIGDQLDALFHAGVFPEEMAAQLQAVKDQFPKE